ncbi:Maff2 family mobile element protein [Ethanoligenens harbinense]
MWGVINRLEGYGSDSPGANERGPEGSKYRI